MPFITVKLAKGRSIQQKRDFARVVTEKAVQILNVKPEWVAIVFDEYSRDNWATAGELHSIKFGDGHGVQGTEKTEKESLT